MPYLVIFLLVFSCIGFAALTLSYCFSATLGQRIAFALFSVWAAWRACLIIDSHYVPSHMIIIAAALALYVFATGVKTWKYNNETKRRNVRCAEAD